MGKGRGSENFPVGSFLIAAERRPQIHAFYRFARRADDVADDPFTPQSEKTAKLDALEAGLDGAPAGDAAALEARAALAASGLGVSYGRSLLSAFRRDAKGGRFANEAELLDYCARSACPVGRFLLDLHQEDLADRQAADALCSALQILNHVQDCKQDYLELNRVYVPQDWLAACGATEEMLGAASRGAALGAALSLMLDLADRLLARAAPLPSGISDRGLRIEVAAILALGRLWASMLRNRDPLARKIRLSRLRIGFAILGAALFFGRERAGA